MATNDWLGWLVPALRLFQLSWVDRKSSVLCAVPPEVTEEHISRHRSALAMAPAATLALGAPTLASFGPAPAAAVPVPKAAMLNYEGSALVEVVAGPLLDALRVDTSIPACVTVQERSGGAALCVLQTGGFDPTVVGSVASRQLADLIALVPTRTPQSIDLIQAQAATIWPFVAAACTKPFEHRLATRALLDVGLAVLHPLIAAAKHHLNVERPQDAALTTAVAMPGHQSAPSGHAAVAYMLAGLLAPLQSAALPRGRLFVAAASIATHRELAGVHFASDSQAGQALGLSLASWLTGLAVSRAPLGATFNLNSGVPPAFATFTAATSATQEWQWLYQRALAEWV